MGDDVGRKMIVAPSRAWVRMSSSSRAWLIASSPKRLVEDDQPGMMDHGAEQLDGLRHAFGQGADRLFRPFPGRAGLSIWSARRRPSASGDRAGADERDCLARRHRRVEAALLGKVADGVGSFDRAIKAEHPPAAC